MQTTYSEQPALGVSGMPYSDGHAKNVEAALAASTLTPGRYAVFDANGKAAHPTAAPTPGTRGGIVLRNMYTDNDGVIAAGQSADIMTDGKCWCDAETAVAMNGQAYVRHVAGVGEFAGKFRNDADALAATGAVISLTETDANVENGTFQVVLRDDFTGAIYDAQFTSSTSSHAVAAAGLVSAIEAAGPFDATAAAEAADAIAITIVSTTAARSVTVLSLTSVGASALAIVSQGVANPDATAIPGLFFRNVLGAAGLALVEINHSATP